jgi:hypothetical protein
MRPVLCPGLRVLRRSATALQIGVDARRALVVDDCPGLRAVLAAMDGVRREHEVIDAAVAAGVDQADAAGVLRALSEQAVLTDADELVGPASGGNSRGPDLAALSLLAWHGRSSGGAVALRSRRRRARVAIVGLGEVGATAARLMAAAGIGELRLSDEVRAPAVASELQQSSLETTVELTAAGTDADVVLFAPQGMGSACEADRDLAAGYMRAGVAHCVATVRETTGVLGPFVVPGWTPCLRCLDLARADADPAWPAVLAQLVPSAHPVPVSDPPAEIALATLVGAWASVELLAYVQELPLATAGATLEVALTHPLPRRREWAAHPGCGCGWHRAATMGA